jgi:hypothetical protein
MEFKFCFLLCFSRFANERFKLLFKGVQGLRLLFCFSVFASLFLLLRFLRMMPG